MTELSVVYDSREKAIRYSLNPLFLAGHSRELHSRLTRVVHGDCSADLWLLDPHRGIEEPLLTLSRTYRVSFSRLTAATTAAMKMPGCRVVVEDVPRGRTQFSRF